MNRYETEPLAEWEREIMDEFMSSVTFTRTDGRTVTLDGVRVDSIGPSAENPGVVGVEFSDDPDRIVHLPFIESWEVSYR